MKKSLRLMVQLMMSIACLISFGMSQNNDTSTTTTMTASLAASSIMGSPHSDLPTRSISLSSSIGQQTISASVSSNPSGSESSLVVSGSTSPSNMMIPSNSQSMIPSNTPSMMPSNTPSNTPIRINESSSDSNNNDTSSSYHLPTPFASLNNTNHTETYSDDDDSFDGHQLKLTLAIAMPVSFVVAFAAIALFAIIYAFSYFTGRRQEIARRPYRKT